MHKQIPNKKSKMEICLPSSKKFNARTNAICMVISKLGNIVSVSKMIIKKKEMS